MQRRSADIGCAGGGSEWKRAENWGVVRTFAEGASDVEGPMRNVEYQNFLPVVTLYIALQCCLTVFQEIDWSIIGQKQNYNYRDSSPAPEAQPKYYVLSQLPRVRQQGEQYLLKSKLVRVRA